MKLVGYLLKKIIPLFLGSLVFFSLILNLVDLFMNIATYLQNNCTVKDILTVMLNYVPKTVWYAIPVAILFSTSYTHIRRYATNSPVSGEQKKYPAPPFVLPSLNPSLSPLNTRVSVGNS